MASTTLADKLDTLAQRLRAMAGELRSGAVSLETDAAKRMSLLSAGADLIDAAGHPRDKMLLSLNQFAHHTAIRMFIKWKAFEKIPTADGTAISYGELAAQLEADPSLIARFARALVANGTLKQIGTDSVAHTEFSKHFTTESELWALVQLIFDTQLTSFVAMPRYFDRFGLAEPTDRLQTVLAFAADKLGSTVWEVNHADEARLRATTIAMGAVEDLMPALGPYDLGWAVRAGGGGGGGAERDRPLLVDVGGGRGQALKAILAATPGLARDRCVLEDLPEVIEAAAAAHGDAELAGVRMVAMDFHKEQPVKGALVYYMRRCLHDYSDAECVGILRHISAAMAADSRLLIVETLLGSPPSPLQAAMDLVMLTISGKERTLDGFREIAAQAGLRVTAVSEIPGGNAVVECGLA